MHGESHITDIELVFAIDNELEGTGTFSATVEIDGAVGRPATRAAGRPCSRCGRPTTRVGCDRGSHRGRSVSHVSLPPRLDLPYAWRDLLVAAARRRRAESGRAGDRTGTPGSRVCHRLSCRERIVLARSRKHGRLFLRLIEDLPHPKTSLGLTGGSPQFGHLRDGHPQSRYH